VVVPGGDRDAIGEALRVGTMYSGAIGTYIAVAIAIGVLVGRVRRRRMIKPRLDQQMLAFPERP
jgi:hypothetical protein